MKVPVCLSLLLFAVPAAAQAPKPVCVRASSDNDYNARPIGLHDVLARSQMGSDRRAVRITTTCTHIDRTAVIGLRSMTLCLGVGDTVAAATPLGPRETCRVAAIGTAPEDYARAKYEYR